MLFYATFAFFVAALLCSSVLALAVPILTYLSEALLNMLLSRYEWGKYFITTNLNLAMYDGSKVLNKGMKPLFEKTTLLFSGAVILLYILVFMVVSSAMFQKRDIL
jgi:ABC-2 type transport system permease protein